MSANLAPTQIEELIEIEDEDSQSPTEPIQIEDISFTPPSIDKDAILNGQTYSYFSPVPSVISSNKTVECALGVDEAGRGPVLGPMVYAVYYLPTEYHYSILRDRHKFTDSKVLSAQTRLSLMQSICTPTTEPSDDDADKMEDAIDNENPLERIPGIYSAGGFATMALSAPSISAGMQPAAGRGAYNLNAQAMDATVALIKGVYALGVNVTEIFVDTIGRPETYQAKLARIFPNAKVVVEKKADATYPVVSAASIAAKVTRDFALEVLWDGFRAAKMRETASGGEGEKKASTEVNHWGCGYPSDAKTIAWLKSEMHPLFGWGPECRFSWATVKDMLEGVSSARAGRSGANGLRTLSVEWAPEEEAESSGMSVMDMIDSFSAKPKKPGVGLGAGGQPDGNSSQSRSAVLSGWYGKPVDGDFSFY